MGLVEHARNELALAGLFSPDSDYGGMLGHAVMKMVEQFASEGHSGASAMMALSIFDRVARWKTLSPLTDNVEEWMPVDMGENQSPTTWQSKRDPSCFSTDGGKTYYDLDDPKREVKPCQSAQSR